MVMSRHVVLYPGAILCNNRAYFALQGGGGEIISPRAGERDLARFWAQERH